MPLDFYLRSLRWSLPRPRCALASSFLERNARTRPPKVGREVIYTDSLYARNMTTGRWMPKRRKNKQLIDRLRQIWRQLCNARPGEVEIAHVRSHVYISGNELADWLADQGRNGAAVTTTQAREWTRAWLDRYDDGGAARGERARGAGVSSSGSPSHVNPRPTRGDG